MRQAVGQASIREEVEDVVSAAQLEQAERQRHLDALEALRIYAHDIAPDHDEPDQLILLGGALGVCG